MPAGVFSQHVSNSGSSRARWWCDEPLVALQANLGRAWLIETQLEGAVLDDANMNKAYLEGLDFENVHFTQGTLLDDVDFANFVVPSERRLPPPDNSLFYALFKQTALHLFEGQAAELHAIDADNTIASLKSIEAYCDNLLPNFVDNLSGRMQEMLKRMLADVLGQQDLAYKIFFKGGAEHIQESAVEWMYHELENGRLAFLLDPHGDLTALLSNLQEKFGDRRQFDVPKGGEKAAIELLTELLSKKEEEAQEDIRKAVKEWIREQVEPKILDLTTKADEADCQKFMSSLIQELDEGAVVALLSKNRQQDLSKFLSEEQQSPGGFLSKILKESDEWRRGFEDIVKRQAEKMYWKQVKLVQSKAADSSHTRALRNKVRNTIWPSADKGPVEGRPRPPTGDKTCARKHMVRDAVKFEKGQQLLMQEWVQRFAEKLPSYMADSVCNAAEKVRQGTTRGWLARSTKYELKGTRGLLHKMMTISPLQLIKHLNELDYLMSRLDKAEEPLQSQTWADSVGAWVALSELLPVIQAERGRLVLEAIFADKGVLDALGKGEFFLKSTGDLPQHMLTTLKANLVGHMQTNLYMYKQAIEHEQANIRRVQEMQGRFIALVGATFAAILVGIANFLGRIAYDYYMDYF
eukprot:gene11472-13556_t